MGERTGCPYPELGVHVITITRFICVYPDIGNIFVRVLGSRLYFRIDGLALEA